MQYPYAVPELPYANDALEPFIDAKTMEIHRTKHHAAYVDKLNAALKDHPDLQAKPLDELLRSLDAVPEAIRTAVRNHGGGHANHSLFWTLMAPAPQGGGGEPAGPLKDALASAFGDFGKFKETFGSAAAGIFGSGWAWLAKDASGALSVLTTPNQDSLFGKNLIPVLSLDVWEHAYYLKYQNKRADYISAWWNVVNWAKAGEHFTG